MPADVERSYVERMLMSMGATPRFGRRVPADDAELPIFYLVIEKQDALDVEGLSFADDDTIEIKKAARRAIHLEYKNGITWVIAFSEVVPDGEFGKARIADIEIFDERPDNKFDEREFERRRSERWR